MIEKIKRKKFIKTALCFVLIVIIIRFVFLNINVDVNVNVNVSNNNTDYVTNDNLILDALQQAKRRESELENKYQVTAIILHWQRSLAVQRLIQYYLNSTLFKEIIVWNNNPQINLTHSQIVTNNNSSIPIHIFNSKENLKDQAKYRACTEAQTLVCFYVDDDWDISRYMRSLIAGFRSDPNVLHSATNDVTYYNNLLWSYVDARIGLHAGFSWIGSGSVFLREHARRHMQLLKLHANEYPDLFAFSDVFFAVWLNDIPSQMVVHLSSLPLDENRTYTAFSATSNFDVLHCKSAMLAARKLEYFLRLNDSAIGGDFPRHQNRRFPYCVRSPGINDDFIFYSNNLPVDIEHVPFNITADADRATYRNVPGGPNYTHFAEHSTLKAADNDEKTCWSPLGKVKKGDFFAIDFLHIQTNITFSLVVGHSSKFQRSLDMRVSYDGVQWISHGSLNDNFINANTSSTTNLHRLVIEPKLFPLELQSFRYIAFNATDALDEAFQVCEIQIIKNITTIAT